jgi:hypothetical protein
LVGLRIQTVNWNLPGFERFTRSAQCAGCVYPRIYANCAALVLIYLDSPRPENSNRRVCGGFNFLFGTYGFER